MNNLIAILLATYYLKNITACIHKNYVEDFDEIESVVEFKWQTDAIHTSKIPRNFAHNCECGYLSNDVNGNALWPWHAFIRVKFPSDDTKTTKIVNCSGSLINSAFVLTAYSCFRPAQFLPFHVWSKQDAYRIKPEDVLIWLPDDNQTLELNPSNALAVTEIIYQLEYPSHYFTEHMTSKNVVLLRLAKEIDFQDPESPKPVCLQPYVPLISGSEAYALKWTSDLMSNPEKYRFLDASDCRLRTSTKIADDQLCVEHPNYIISDQQGGGPLIYPTKEYERFIQIGVGSWVHSLPKTDDNSSRAMTFYTFMETTLPFINYYSAQVNAVWCNEIQKSHFDLIPWINFDSSKRQISDSCTCGIKKGFFEQRIVGGDNSERDEFKWQVYIKIGLKVNEKKGTLNCGGTIINDRFILTAAHCFFFEDHFDQGPINVDDIEVYANAYTWPPDEDTRAKRLKVKHLWYHPQFLLARKNHYPYFDYDVALLELQTPLDFSEGKVQPICILGSEEAKPPLIGEIATVSGWGLTSIKSDGTAAGAPKMLQKIEIPIQELNYCRNAVNEIITRRFICAGTLDRNKDAAKGDSGGPMIILGRKSNQFVQVGVVSFGVDVVGSTTTTAGLYTNVFHPEILSYIDFHSYRGNAIWCTD